MSVDTKAIIRKGTTIDEIVDALSIKYSDVRVLEGYCPEMFRIILSDESENIRSIFISYGDSAEHDFGIPGTYLSLGCYGNSVEIMKYLCETFGGYLMENDCSEDAEFYPINHKLFLTGSELSELDSFKHKVISKLGHNNLKIVMELFEEYSTIAPQK